MSDTARKSDEELLTEAAMFFDCFDSLSRLPLPVICYAHGAVHGGANGLVAASDFVLCTEDTRFSFSEVRLGLVPATVAPFVLRRMGPTRARQCMISGEVMDGHEACAGGLADRVVRREDAEGKIGELVAMLKQNAPGAVRMTKKMLLEIEHKTIMRETRGLTTEMIARARKSEEAQEGLDAFFSKRIPNWRNTQ
jgi:methylglutaconyl-CoA hydratase